MRAPRCKERSQFARPLFANKEHWRRTGFESFSTCWTPAHTHTHRCDAKPTRSGAPPKTSGTPPDLAGKPGMSRKYIRGPRLAICGERADKPSGLIHRNGAPRHAHPTCYNYIGDQHEMQPAGAKPIMMRSCPNMSDTKTCSAVPLRLRSLHPGIQGVSRPRPETDSDRQPRPSNPWTAKHAERNMRAHKKSLAHGELNR